jgi:hypothetical protein
VEANFTLNAWFLLAAGVPMGPDVLLTVRGHKYGQPRDAGGDL